MKKDDFVSMYRKLTNEDIVAGKSIVFARDLSIFANDPEDEIDIFGPYTFTNPAVIDGYAQYEKAGKRFSCSVVEILKGQSNDGIIYRCHC